ncbi:MAG: hypothetical protein J6W80_03105 [Kiritimatiellae bacterium]|nr:hypothetical protein [Kiritimatiellia bacterium]
MKRNTIGFIAALVVALAAPAPGAAAKQPILPEREWKMIREVAVNYDLDEESTWLLAAIRRHENGRPGLEFGVGGPMDNGHPAHRYRDGYKSFYIQAMWAAGTVKRHYDGDLAKFGKRYNPPYSAQWTRGVASLISRLKAENHYRLPGEKPAKRKIEFP